jgi:hypothetical protein
MKMAVISAAALLIGIAAASAQGMAQSSRPSVGMGSKTMEFCKADIQKHCARASGAMQKECLVKNWDHISNDCQDAVGTSGRRPMGAAE